MHNGRHIFEPLRRWDETRIRNRMDVDEDYQGLYSSVTLKSMGISCLLLHFQSQNLVILYMNSGCGTTLGDLVFELIVYVSSDTRG